MEVSAYRNALMWASPGRWLRVSWVLLTAIKEESAWCHLRCHLRDVHLQKMRNDPSFLPRRNSVSYYGMAHITPSHVTLSKLSFSHFSSETSPRLKGWCIKLPRGAVRIAEAMPPWPHGKMRLSSPEPHQAFCRDSQKRNPAKLQSDSAALPLLFCF